MELYHLISKEDWNESLRRGYLKPRFKSFKESKIFKKQLLAYSPPSKNNKTLQNF